MQAHRPPLVGGFLLPQNGSSQAVPRPRVAFVPASFEGVRWMLEAMAEERENSSPRSLDEGVPPVELYEEEANRSLWDGSGALSRAFRTAYRGSSRPYLGQQAAFQGRVRTSEAILVVTPHALHWHLSLRDAAESLCLGPLPREVVLELATLFCERAREEERRPRFYALVRWSSLHAARLLLQEERHFRPLLTPEIWARLLQDGRPEVRLALIRLSGTAGSLG